MKNKKIAYCGVDCGECQVLIATETNNDELRQSYAEMLSSKYNLSVKAENINCVGCVKGTMEGGILMGHCQNCDVRMCAGEKNVKTCAGCSGFICEKLETKWNGFPPEIKAKENLI